MYVALSRVTTLDGLFLTGVFNKKAFAVDKRAKDEYKYLREHQNLITDSEFNDNNQLFSMILCNVRSLQKHIIDIKSDQRFLENDMILCTETQLTNDEHDIKIDRFSVLCNNSPHKFSSIAAFSKNTNRTIEEFQLDGVSIFGVIKENLELKILLLYRKSDWAITGFYELLHYLSIANKIDFIMGDFNLKPNDQLGSLLDEYSQLVTEPTHLALGASYLKQLSAR